MNIAAPFKEKFRNTHIIHTIRNIYYRSLNGIIIVQIRSMIRSIFSLN